MLPGVCQQPFCRKSGQLHVDFELKSPAEKVWGTIRDSTTIFPQALSHDYKSIQVLEGDGKAPGSVRLINYSEGSPIVKVSKERIESVDEAENKYVYSIIDGDLLKYYKTFIGKVIVVPKGESSLVKWSYEFEKASEEIPDPSVIKEFAVITLRRSMTIFTVRLREARPGHAMPCMHALSPF
ncbi:MLP-like protein 423 [Gossypium australe]|uniref:MLP-like protein 423 n=1 Tax=Gossypium australe TaxID=47621 RepID=A0A5B6WNI4_9ROSI|nr:MLP-like protein 423 [Gossypium australe]